MRRYLQRMTRVATYTRGFVLGSGFALAALLASTWALWAMPLSATASSTPAGAAPKSHSLLRSRELWATVDVCNPADKPDTVGVRGSMPGDGHGKDAMYMRFQLQYLEAKDDTWVSLAHGGDSGFIGVGQAKTALQSGTSFQIVPVKGEPPYTMRGIVTFQWRHGASVLHEVTRTTSAAHKSVADADPAGYSAAQCVIG